MLIVGELINTSRKVIKLAVENRDARFIQEVAQNQIDAGANYIDVNWGTRVFDEMETMSWLGNDPFCMEYLAANRNGLSMKVNLHKSRI